MFKTENKAKQGCNTISVSDFIRKINFTLSSHISRIQGEVTSVNKAYPKVIYFKIKDDKEDALLNCIIWKSIYEQNGIDLKVGDKIIITGVPEVYSKNGSLSLKTRTIEYIGEGALKKAYEELYKKLDAEGLFAFDRKRDLPKYPMRIGVITSKAGVVMQDLSSNLGRYGYKMTIIDSRVEGKDAVHELLTSIRTMAKEDIEVLVIIRGGGSWESLQSFNTESVVRAIANFKCPVLTGIGHDVDVTLSELVADVGKSTPSIVAKTLNESWDKLTNYIESSEIKVIRVFQGILSDQKGIIKIDSNKILYSYKNRLSDSKELLSGKKSKISSIFLKLSEKITRANLAFQNIVGIMKSNIQGRRAYLSNVPLRVIHFSKFYLNAVKKFFPKIATQLNYEQRDMIQNAKNGLINIEKSINRSNPERNLRLGYNLSYVKDKLIRSVKDISLGDIAKIHLVDGKFSSEIKNIKNK
ncbi:MAG: exodeoxyribonuclease VII large subunit [Candidatus Pacebacteria bacterium]|nr:exodeoxyribonuclease VII large subunit [Candidatus Paceibacterota bacterium]